MTQNRLKMKWMLIVLFTISIHFCVFAQHVSNFSNGVKGFWTQDSNSIFNDNWQAQWIWMPENIESDMMLARGSFNLSEIPNSSKLRISASSKYQLYVNGEYVCQGPARSASHHQSFDILEVTSLLKEGKNTLAVRVHYQRGTTSYHLKGRAGLLVQLDVNDSSKTTIISDENWKVQPELSWDNNSVHMNRFQLVQNDNVDLNKKTVNFETLDFDDSNWLNAKPLIRNSGWPSPKKNEKATTLTTPWVSLVPRDIPYLVETELRAVKLIEAKQVQISNLDNASFELTGRIHKDVAKKLKQYIKANKPLLLPISEEEKTLFYLFDFGKVINGMPKLIIEGKQNTEVNILAAPFVVDNSFTHKIVASNYHDKIILSGEKDTWQSMYFKPSRYMSIAVKGNEIPVKIHFAGIHQLEYPFELKGKISTSEAPWIENLWNASIKTIDACTTDAFTDNYRERRQYAQTGYYAALGNYFTYGDYALQRRYLIQVAQEQQANGLMPAYAPLTGDDYMVILDSNCMWIRSLYNYFLYSGDIKTVIELLPAAEKLMELLGSFTNDLDMLDSPPYSYWLDHTLNDRTGANLTLNGHYLGALEDYSKVLEWLNKAEESHVYKSKAEKLRQSLGLFWDEEKQLFADAYLNGKRSTQFSEHANAMALACKISTPEQAKIVAKTLLAKDNHDFIKRENGITMVTPAMSYFLHKGLADNGYVEASLQLLKNRFNKMLNPDTNGTLWEEWWRNGTGRTGKFQERTRSDAQTESVFPPALFAKYILGVEVTKPGMTEILISKPSVSLSKIEGTIPSPQGKIGVKWSMNKKSTLYITIPEGVNSKLDIKSLKGNSLKVNGNELDSSVLSQGFLILSNGGYEISF